MIRIRVLTPTDRMQAWVFLSKYFSNIEKFDKARYGEHVFSVGAFDNEKLVGHIFIHEGYEYLNHMKYYTLEYVVVDEKYRRNGLAKKLFRYVSKIAKDKQIGFLTLTSKPSRVEARYLYNSLGFEGKDTGVFVKVLKG